MERRAAAFALLGAVVATASIFACRQIVGFNESSPGGSSPDASIALVCGLPYGTSECAACVHTSCCAESAACAEDNGCAAYEGCLGACNGDPGCRAQCLIDHRSGYTASSSVPPLGACLASNCATACGLGACGTSASVVSTSPDAAAACQSCLQAKECPADRACSSSADCIANDQCARGCPTLDCIEGCVIHHEAGAALATPVGKAFVGSCASPCGLGRDWSCLGQVSWPVAQSTTVAMTVAVQSGSAPVPGAMVSVSEYCPPLAESATPVLAEGETDDAGTVTLPQVPQSTTAGPGINHGLDGCLTVTAPGYLPTFWYWGFPLTEPVVVFTPTEPGGASDWVPLVTSADVSALNMAAGISAPDPSRGTVGVTLLDCEGAPAPDVQIAPEPDDTGIRILYGLALDATRTQSDTTGLAFLVNVPPGVLTLTATIANGKPSSIMTVNVAANTFTEALMYPTP